MTENLAAALVAFQAEAPKIVKDATNPHFKSKFASLESILTAVRPVLSKHGLALIQHPTCAGTVDNPLPALRTVLLHTSGEREEDVMLLLLDKTGPQAQGAALTYAKRQAIQAVLGLSCEEDDDGNAAQAAHEKARRGGPDPAPPPPNPESKFHAPAAASLSEKQAKRLKELKAQIVPGHLSEDEWKKLEATNEPVEFLRKAENFAKSLKAAAA